MRGADEHHAGDPGSGSTKSPRRSRSRVGVGQLDGQAEREAEALGSREPLRVEPDHDVDVQERLAVCERAVEQGEEDLPTSTEVTPEARANLFAVALGAAVSPE